MSLVKALSIATLVLTVTAGCSDVTPSSPSNDAATIPLSSLDATRNRPRDVPRVTIDRPQRPRPWDENDAGLVAALVKADGRAVVAFKEAVHARALTTGVREAVSATAVRAGLDMLRTNQVEVLQLLDAIGAAVVRVDPALGPTLRAHPLVDYVEPAQVGKLATAGGRVAARMGNGYSQTIPWGVQMSAHRRRGLPPPARV